MAKKRHFYFTIQSFKSKPKETDIWRTVRIDLVNDKIVKLTDKLGDEMKLTINSHGDILDADTNQIYASGGYRHRKSEYFLWEIF